MGCDGGSIPRREELVKTKERAAPREEGEIQRARWQLCALTKEPLREPVVIDSLGTLFSKEALLTALVRKDLPAAFSHIRSARDVREVHLTRNPSWREGDTTVPPFVCPVTMAEAGVNVAAKFVAVAPCGCVVSEKALQQVPSKVCLVCGSAVDESRFVVVNGTEEDIARLRLRMESVAAERKAKLKAKTKEKEPEKEKEKRAEPTPEGGGNGTDSSPSTAAKKPRQQEMAPKPRASVVTTTAAAAPVPVGAREAVYKSLFHSSSEKDKGKRTSQDLFCRGGFGGNT